MSNEKRITGLRLVILVPGSDWSDQENIKQLPYTNLPFLHRDDEPRTAVRVFSS